MPEPRFEGYDYSEDAPSKVSELLGLGPENRKSKTFLTGPDMAFVLTKIRTKRRLVINSLRESHAKHHDRPIYEEDEDGDPVEVGREPDLLSDEEIIAKYTSARWWDDLHQEFVAHMASVDGLTIKAVSGLEDDDRRRTPDSTAGSDDKRF